MGMVRDTLCLLSGRDDASLALATCEIGSEK